MGGSPPLTVLADTGAVYALIDRSDAWHARVIDWWRAATDEVRLPVTVLPELAFLLSRRLGAPAELAFVRALAAREFVVEPAVDEDLPRIAEIMAQYMDAPVGFVDASVVASAERLGVISILTTDRRHFSLIRPEHVPSLRLLP